MAPGRVLLHIGLPKTGTTSLQEVLRGWPGGLAGKPFDRPGGSGGRAVQEAARAGTLTGAALDAHLAAARQDPDVPVILSAEALAGTPREWFVPFAQPAAMAGQLAATTWDARVLVTLRRPRPWLRSVFRYSVAGGYAETYGRFLDRVTADLDAGRGLASWAVTVGAYDHAFGADAVAIAWFEDMVDDPSGHWDAVAARLDLPELRLLGETPLPRLNDAHVGPPALERTLNRFVLRSDIGPGRGPRLMTRARYQRRIGARLVRRSSEAWFTDRTTVAEPAVVDRLADAAERIAAIHGAPIPGDLRSS